MTYENLDNDELLRLALDAINSDRDADGVVLLKTLLQREPAHMHGQYLLAAQHAQLGMMDRAEAGFQSVVAQAADFPIARFQLAQLLLTQGRTDEARRHLASLAELPRALALSAYARALLALVDDDRSVAICELEAGLQHPQDIPALAMDMERLLKTLQTSSMVVDEAGEHAVPAAHAHVSPLFLTSYGRET